MAELEISYFAWVREAMGQSGEILPLPPGVADVSALIAWLAARDERGAAAFARPERIRVAVDGEMVSANRSIVAAREVALFPPVTGG